ncbi:class I SAM-dependent methyltransferase [Nocardioides daeguensis]|uniref:Class I SAM-dependent methyltransferase n=1 Tax=Nocardioides daeguensis TaxID=908359 RepID=A0ABP6V400_9ACTN|nr:class I SAM-dependent methyltransferase [Nocardioides daeguensis]MBV6727284.1 methyltransferase domain-containing protein [Nocardioides daeguensis]MCR1771298.1 methyltransferase domain-containing protein [Nocardioides daeguensis]
MSDAAPPRLPPTRWALGGDRNPGYGERFAQLIADGTDVVGEARLADTLVERGATILDAGSGMGRIGAHLLALGHRVIAAEPDPVLATQSRRTFPDLPVVPHEILTLTPEALTAAGAPTAYDLVVCVGNVLTFVAERTEVAVLERLGSLLATGGRILVGFHLQQGPSTAREYTPEEFLADVDAAGLVVQHRFGGYDLRPADDLYSVAILSQP